MGFHYAFWDGSICPPFSHDLMCWRIDTQRQQTPLLARTSDAYQLRAAKGDSKIDYLLCTLVLLLLVSFLLSPGLSDISSKWWSMLRYLFRILKSARFEHLLHNPISIYRDIEFLSCHTVSSIYLSAQLWWPSEPFLARSQRKEEQLCRSDSLASLTSLNDNKMGRHAMLYRAC